MERIFTNKSIWKKIVVAILIIMAFQVIFSTPIVNAKDPDDASQQGDGDNTLWAGILMRPILSLVVTIGDGIVSILHNTIMGQDNGTLLTIEGGTLLDKIGAVLLGVIIAAGIIIACIAAAYAIAAIPALVAAFDTAAGAVVFGTAAKVIVVGGIGAGVLCGVAIGSEAMPDTLKLPVYSYSAEEIFRGNILLFNVDFFNRDNKQIMVNYSKQVMNATTQDPDYNPGADQQNGQLQIEYEWEEQSPITPEEYNSLTNGTYKVNYYYYEKDGKIVKTSPQDSARELHSLISTGYVAIRNICIVLMLSILIYIGIRMMLTSVSSEKAKYKDMIKDWVTGLCLLFLMHYIMAFSVLLVEKLTDVVNTYESERPYLVSLPDEYDGNLKDVAEEINLPSEYISDERISYPTNLMGKFRLMLQKKDTEQSGAYIGYVMCFLILVLFTVMFTITYLRRLLYMAFLTMISPMVAVTYCIDKTNDGQAQGFNMWLKEYIFNLLIQPMHLLLYYILVISAYELANSNVIYAIVALGFMIPAEKLLRSMFGFEKAKTPPLLGGAVGASLMMQGVNSLSRLARGRGRGEANERKLKGKGDEEEGLPARLNSVSTMDTLAKNSKGDGNLLGESTEGDGLPGKGSKWATPELDETMGAIDQDEQALREAAYTDLRDPESFDAYKEMKDELDERRKNALLEDYKIRMANQGALNEGTGEGTGTDDQDAQDSSGTSAGGMTGSASTPNITTPMTFRQAMGSQFNRDKDKLKRALSATKAGAKVAIKNAPRKIGKKAFKLAKGAAGGIMAGTAVAALGGAAAIASGDTKNIVTAAGATVGTGYAAGRRAANSSLASHLSPETREAFNEVYHGEKYKHIDVEKASKEERTNANNRLKAEQGIEDREMKEKLAQAEQSGASKQEMEKIQKEKEKADKKAAEEFMKDGGNYDKMIQAGVRDIDRAIVLQKGIDEGVYQDVEDAVAHSQLYDQFGQKDPTKMGHKDQENFNKTIYSGLTSRNIGEQKAKDRVKEISNGLSFLHNGLHG